MSYYYRRKKEQPGRSTLSLFALTLYWTPGCVSVSTLRTPRRRWLFLLPCCTPTAWPPISSMRILLLQESLEYLHPWVSFHYLNPTAVFRWPWRQIQAYYHGLYGLHSLHSLTCTMSISHPRYHDSAQLALFLFLQLASLRFFSGPLGMLLPLPEKLSSAHVHFAGSSLLRSTRWYFPNIVQPHIYIRPSITLMPKGWFLYLLSLSEI